MTGGRNSASVHLGQKEAEPLRGNQLNAFPGRLGRIRGIDRPQTWNLGGSKDTLTSPSLPKSDKALEDVVRMGRGKGFFDMPLQLLCQRHTWKAQSRKLLGH